MKCILKKLGEAQKMENNLGFTSTDRIMRALSRPLLHLSVSLGLFSPLSWEEGGSLSKEKGLSENTALIYNGRQSNKILQFFGRGSDSGHPGSDSQLSGECSKNTLLFSSLLFYYIHFSPFFSPSSIVWLLLFCSWPCSTLSLCIVLQIMNKLHAMCTVFKSPFIHSYLLPFSHICFHNTSFQITYLWWI